MKKTALLLSSLLLAIATVAAPTPEHSDGLAIFGGSADEYMPTLSEMLGEDVDNYGEFDPNLALKVDMVDFAKQYLGTRYVRGGKTPRGFDCSGFTSYIFKNFGMKLDAASSMQGRQGEHVDIKKVEVGDLLFFSGRRGGSGVGHVAMVIDVDHDKGTLKFIHASSSNGIEIQRFPDNGYYSKRFLLARRILEN